MPSLLKTIARVFSRSKKRRDEALQPTQGEDAQLPAVDRPVEDAVQAEPLPQDQQSNTVTDVGADPLSKQLIKRKSPEQIRAFMSTFVYSRLSYTVVLTAAQSDWRHWPIRSCPL